MEMAISDWSMMAAFWDGDGRGHNLSAADPVKPLSAPLPKPLVLKWCQTVTISCTAHGRTWSRTCNTGIRFLYFSAESLIFSVLVATMSMEIVSSSKPDASLEDIDCLASSLYREHVGTSLDLSFLVGQTRETGNTDVDRKSVIFFEKFTSFFSAQCHIHDIAMFSTSAV